MARYVVVRWYVLVAALVLGDLSLVGLLLRGVVAMALVLLARAPPDEPRAERRMRGLDGLDVAAQDVSPSPMLRRFATSALTLSWISARMIRRQTITAATQAIM